MDKRFLLKPKGTLFSENSASRKYMQGSICRLYFPTCAKTAKQGDYRSTLPTDFVQILNTKQICRQFDFISFPCLFFNFQITRIKRMSISHF